MSEKQTLATSIGKTQPHSITFEISDYFLSEETAELKDWSAPVQFRLEQREDGVYDLVFRTIP